jgi:CRISPR system Cascade subunit CasA
MPSFNLIDNKWIPCILVTSGQEELSIREIFTELKMSGIQEISDSSPLVTVGIHRLLLAILHRNFGPRDGSAWAKIWNSGDWDTTKLMGYLDKWHDRFNLFDEKYPFYQSASLPVSAIDAKGKVKSYASSVSGLIHELAAGGNATLFDHSTDDKTYSISSAEAARLLVAFQPYAVGGLLTFETGQDPKLYKSADNAPMVKGAAILVKGDNLFRTLMLNLNSYGVSKNDTTADAPAWEQEHDALREESPKGLLDLLTWQSRRVKLIQEQNAVTHVVIMKGNQFPDNYSLHEKEPMLAFRKVLKPTKGQDPLPPLAFREDRALWRDSLSLFESTVDKTRPLILDWLSELTFEGHIAQSTVINLEVMGMITNQAKIILWRDERLPLPIIYLEDKKLCEKLKTALEIADKADRLLGPGFHSIKVTDKDGKKKEMLFPSPLRQLAAGILYPANPREADKNAVVALVLSISPSRSFWAEMGISFDYLLSKLPEDQQGGEYGATILPWWNKVVRNAALKAFDQAVEAIDQTGRILKETTLAEKEFRIQLAKIIPNTKKGGEA